jgi:DNA damage-binding protein 1
MFADDPAPYFVVGTAYILPTESEPTRGRILVLSYSPADRALTVVAEKDTRGAVFALVAFNGRLLATVNSKARWGTAERVGGPD